jgi:aryl-alcohol dehydrogenase-like predicted oxidoreductase
VAFNDDPRRAYARASIFAAHERANIAQSECAPATHPRRMNERARTDRQAHARQAHAHSTVRIGDLTVQRLGYGAMRLPGKDAWGEPDDPTRAHKVLRRAVELGVDFIDTAWFYGPLVANRIIAEALHPYPRGLVIATKLGAKRNPDKSWAPALRPEELRKGLEEDLRTLRVERVDVVHLRHAPAARVPLMESLDALRAMQAVGKIRHLALSNVNVRELEEALVRTPIVAVQNMFNVSGGGGALAKHTRSEVDDPERVLDLCTEKKIAFVPFFPLGGGNVVREKALATSAKKRDASPAQIALAWLLARSPVMLPIPGTSSLDHLEENWRARNIVLGADEMKTISSFA